MSKKIITSFPYNPNNNHITYIILYYYINSSLLHDYRTKISVGKTKLIFFLQTV